MFQSYLTGIEICKRFYWYRSRCVPIVPNWNWNDVINSFNDGSFAFQSYLTGIEMRSQSGVYVRDGVPIVPFWNWNNNWQKIYKNPSQVPIVPFWNWNRYSSGWNGNGLCSNRTLLELKPWESRKKLWALSVSAVTHWCAFDRSVVSLRWRPSLNPETSGLPSRKTFFLWWHAKKLRRL